MGKKYKFTNTNGKMNNSLCSPIDKIKNRWFFRTTIDQHFKFGHMYKNIVIIKLRKLHCVYIDVKKSLNVQTLLMIYFVTMRSVLQHGMASGDGLCIVRSDKILKTEK